MKRFAIAAAGLACLAFAQPVVAADNEMQPSFLFVQEASAGTYDGKTLTLADPSPTITAFADRPNRVVKDIRLSHFVDVWTQGADSFKDDPPNAALIAEGLETIIVELHNPRSSDAGLRYDISVLSGDLPSEMTGVTLVIDDNESWCDFGIGCWSEMSIGL
ncbi:hypothetical protein [Hoeflea prorocentri]|uniref:Uncharacterized protein n=1 Tax=Hoeflea prorocentri TaxID=1922333 RepID=A0A9X3UJK3_9HYPH|nr:hypothetical protein [Hoeflea prorocentri]MCY6381772.1 hypothetical protein [Hoeflea prorocentri]MDA5399572.1 hypothetical protein [Hoeflea prorocentri]